MSAGYVDREAQTILKRAGEEAAKRRLRIVGYEITGMPGTPRTFRYSYAPLERARRRRSAPEASPAKAQPQIRQISRGVVREPRPAPKQGTLL